MASNAAARKMEEEGGGALWAWCGCRRRRRREECVSLQREIYSYSLPRFRRTVSAVPPRYALAATVAAKVTEEEEREVGGRADGRAKKEGATSPLPSPLIHPISHTFLSHLAEYDRGPAPRLPYLLCVCPLWPTIRS